VPKPFKIDQDNLRMKCSALNIDFNGVRFDPLGSRSPPYERIKFGYPLEKVQFFCAFFVCMILRQLADST